jgi:hypothetical protein
MTEIWVLTREYNDYDQYGEYFIDAWDHKPTAEEICQACYVADASHILAGGGRQAWEDCWYHLRKHK